MNHAPPIEASVTTPIEEARLGRPSGWLLVGVLVGGAGLCISAYLNVDPDLYWHRVLGSHWIHARSLDLTPDPIAYTPGHSWFPTSWSVEVLYAGLVAAFGYPGIFALRFALAMLFYGLLGRFMFRAARATTAALLLFLVGLPASLMVQDRPQTFSLVFVALALPSISRALREDITPPLIPLVVCTWVWANVHGLWVLVPGLLGLLTIVRVVEHRPTWRSSGTATLLCVVAAALTPVGPRLLLSPLLVTRAAGAVVEWEPTALRTPVAWGLAACLLLLLITWSRIGAVPARFLIYAVLVAAFGLMAYRNAVFASLLLTPLVLAAVDEAFPRFDSRATVPRFLVLAVLPVLLIAGVSTYVQHAHVSRIMPHKIAAYLAGQPSVHHVVVAYNATGFIREFAGDHVRVSIDGRSDRYGSKRITAQNDMLNGTRGWHKRLTALTPDAVVMARTSPLRELLTERHWSTIMVDQDYVLMEPAQ
jgi:hypothetical protein